MSLLLLIVAVVVQMGKGGLPIIIVVFVIMIMMMMIIIIMIAVVGIAVPASPLPSLPASLPSPIKLIACARVVRMLHRIVARRPGHALLTRAWGTSILTAFSRIL